MDAIELRDVLGDEESPWVREDVVRRLLERGWSVARIMGELPTLPPAMVCRVSEGLLN